MKKNILNLACGLTYIKGAINVDYTETKTCDMEVNLTELPWPWTSNSIDEIYMLHIIEHFDSDTVIAVLKEIHRILKKGGLIHIQCPHFSSMLALACIDHKKPFSILSFSFLEHKNYITKIPLFKDSEVKINYLMMLHKDNKYINFDPEKSVLDDGEHRVMRKVFFPFFWLIQAFINLSPLFFERFWCYWVGGADELVYRAKKI